MLSGGVPKTDDIDRYLAYGERVVYVLRRHTVVLDKAIGTWLLCVTAGVGLGLLAGREPTWHLGVIGGWLVLGGAAFLAWKVAGWWLARYVITEQRVLLVEGVISRRVRAVPLSKVTHTDYTRSLIGRVFGFGSITLDSAGSRAGGLREVTTIPRPDEVYRLIMSLVAGSGGRGKVSGPDPSLQDTGPLPRLIL